MSKMVEYFIMGFFVVAGLTVVFVKAGKTGFSGGQQTAQIISSGGKALSDVATSIEGG